VLARSVEDPQPAAVRDAGMHVTAAVAAYPAELARSLLDRATGAQILWIGSPDADPGLTDALAAEVARRGGSSAPEIEVLIGSWDMPGARLLDAVAVMDRLRSPGGCPWDAEQTHTSLVPYLIEEAYEAVEALETGDREHITEELGDVLLQVLFHARLAEEHEESPFDIDEVAGGLVAKLVRRHPHVFAPAGAAPIAPAGAAPIAPAEVETSWDRIKAGEKPHREHPLDGIPAGMPELARAVKVASRLERAGQGERLREHVARSRKDAGEGAAAAAVAADLMDIVLQAGARAVDPSAALRTLLRSLAEEGFGSTEGR